MEEYIFRTATLDDWESVNRLKKQVHAFHQAHRPDFFVRSDEPLSRDYFGELIDADSYNIFVLEQAQEILAYAITRMISYKANPLIADHSRLYIEDLCVDEKARNRGIGTTFFKAIEAFCKEKQIPYISLDVWDFNEKAASFYKNMGMSKVIERFEKRVDFTGSHR